MKTLLAFLLALCSLSAPCFADGSRYNPAANPFADLQQAKTAAGKSGKHILLIAGGNWCNWCQALDQYLQDNADVSEELHTNFEVLKIYVGEENMNAKFFDTLPKFAGVPHFWILTAEGKVLESVASAIFEDKYERYNKPALLQFIRQYAKR
jgi:thioredoxin-related protein